MLTRYRFISSIILLLLVRISHPLLAQNIADKGPGGIKATVWYKPDAPQTLFSDAGSTPANDGQSVYQWNNAYGTGHNLVQTSSTARPILGAANKLVNFHRTVNFTASQRMAVTLATGVKIIDRNTGTIYAAAQLNTATSSRLAGFSANLNQPGIIFNTSRTPIFYNGSASVNYGSSVTLSTPFIVGAGWKNESGGSSLALSLNGAQQTATGTAIVTTTAASESFTIGKPSSGNSIVGQINEVVVFDRKLTSKELNKVDTYFAIKYGTTLAPTTNYTSSNGSVIWNAGANQKYSNNIAGIGRDDASTLDQKQAWSTNSNKEILISTSGLAATNQDNNTSLANGQFFVWGDNGGVKAPIVEMPRHGTLNYRLEAIWKVQNTNQVGAVRVAWQKRSALQWVLVVSKDEVFDHSDAQYPLNQSIDLNGTPFEYVDAPIPDGYYFTLATATAAPGGVMPAVWYRSDAEAQYTLFSDAGTTLAEDKQPLQQWKEFYDTGINFIQASTAYRPLYSSKTTLSNFHPTITLDGADRMTATPTSEQTIIDREDGSIFVQGNYAKKASVGIAGFGTSTRFPGFITASTGIPHFRVDNSRTVPGNTALNVNENFTLGGTWKNNGDSTGTSLLGTFSLNGVHQPLESSNFVPSASANLLHFGHDVSSSGITGQVNEIAVFEHRLNNDELNRIETYMALKYGYSKNYADGTKNYVNADNEIVWDAQKNAAYRFNIAGIAHDSKGALHQKQAWSTHTDKEILISTTGLSHTNHENKVALQEGQYLIWGDNGLVKDPTVAMPRNGRLNYRLAAIWKAQNTKEVKTVRVAWQKRSSTQWVLMISKDEVFDHSDAQYPLNQSIDLNGTPFEYVDAPIPDGYYFTLATATAAPGGVMPAVWYRSDAEAQHTLFSDAGTTLAEDQQSLQQWNEYYETGINFIQTSTAYRPLYSSKTTLNNFHPTLTLDGMDRMTATPTSEQTIIDRQDGSIFVQGHVTKRSAAGIAGFGTSTRFPGFITASTGVAHFRVDNSRTVAGETPLQAGDNFTLGGTWKNNGDSTGTSLLGTFSLNGVHQTLESSNFTPSTSANLLQFGHDGSSGGLVGQVNEMAVFEHRLSEDELSRVESYMALKYGHSKSYANGTKNYLNANSDIVWDATRNADYRYNIAGIAFDIKGGLNQKQAWSMHTDHEILIGTTGLANTNGENNVSLQHNQFLIWGDNNKVKEPIIHLPKHPVLNYRFEAIWKVQNTNNTDTVRVAWPSNSILKYALMVSEDNVFDNNDPFFEMKNTLTINGKVYNYVDVQLKDGIFFSIAAIHPAPGGVIPSVWYRSDAEAKHTLFADAGITLIDDAQSVQQWNDYYRTGNNFLQNTTAYRPRYSSSQTLNNFHPTITLDGADRMIANPVEGENIIDRQDGSILVQGYHAKRSAAGIVGFGTSTRFPGFITASTGISHFRVDNSRTVAADQKLTLGQNFTMIGTWKNNGDETETSLLGTFSMNGYYHTLQATNFNPSSNAQMLQLGYDGSSGGMYGQINEIAVFEQRLHEDELFRVQSYMAIKYGNSKNYADGKHHYLNANSDIVWDATRNAQFRYNIAGIAKDVKGGLNQKQAWSTHSTNEILISTTGLAHTNELNPLELAHNQYLIWGDNGLAKKPIVYMESQAGENINFRFEAIWKVQNTNNVGTVRVAWPKSNRHFSLLQSTDATFERIDKITPMEQVITLNGKEYIYADVELADNTYFTLGMHGKAPGGVLRGLSHWYRADQGVGSDGQQVVTWEDLISNTTAQQVASAPLPHLQAGSKDHLNFNPSIHFTSVEQMLGNLSVVSLDSTQFDIVSLLKQGNAGTRFFSIGLIDSTGTSVANWAHPGLNVSGQVVRKSNLDQRVYQGTPRTPSATSPSILLHRFTTTTTRAGLNGANLSSPVEHDSVGLVQGGHIFGANNGDVQGFTGHIGELMLFGEGSLSEIDRTKIESYLAIKYGITLNSRNNYIRSDNTIIWNADENATYHHNIAGIGADELSMLHQKQSRSQVDNTNDQVIISIASLAADNQNNTGTIPDGQFLVWGDNNNKYPMTNNSYYYSNVRYLGRIRNGRRMKRVWKVQNTGLQQPVDIRFPIASVGTTTLTNDACAMDALVIAKDANFTEDVTFLPVTKVDGYYQANYTFPDGYSFFSFARIVPTDEAYIYLPKEQESSNEHNTGSCIDEWIYYNKKGQQEQKILALYGYTNEQLSRLEVTITPTGLTYRDSQVTAKLMPRVTTLKGLPTVKRARIAAEQPDSTIVRVYYSQSELNNTHFSGYRSAGWFYYPGDETAVYNDLEDDGQLDRLVAVPLMPSHTGSDDGTRYVEFINAPTEGSFVYVASSNRTVLPVQLVHMQVTAVEQQVMVQWTTASEVNNDYFEVQRSDDAKQWISMGRVYANESGTTTQSQSYQFVDQSPLNGTSYYRLKQVDRDGSFEYSPFQSVVRSGQSNNLSIYPNPITDGKLRFSTTASVQSCYIIDLQGQEVLHRQVDDKNELELSLPAGMYLLKVQTKEGQLFIKPFVIH